MNCGGKLSIRIKVNYFKTGRFGDSAACVGNSTARCIIFRYLIFLYIDDTRADRIKIKLQLL